jgi:hypothetical protein
LKPLHRDGECAETFIDRVAVLFDAGFCEGSLPVYRDPQRRGHDDAILMQLTDKQADPHSECNVVWPDKSVALRRTQRRQVTPKRRGCFVRVRKIVLYALLSPIG